MKGAFEVVLELVQQHVGIGRGDDYLLARYVAAQNPPIGGSLLLGVEPAYELDFRLRAEEHAHWANLIEISARGRGLRFRGGPGSAPS